MEQNNITETATTPNPQTSAPRQAAPQGQAAPVSDGAQQASPRPRYAAKCAADSPC